MKRALARRLEPVLQVIEAPEPARPRRHLLPWPGRKAKLEADAGRQLNLGAAILALSVLADSGIEHYRGGFRNKAMFTPLVSASMALGASVFGVGDRRAQRHPARDAIYGLAAAVGLTGLGFHAYNVAKRPGGVSWQNLFYAAPIGAPAALALSGLLGRGAELARDGHPRRTRILGGRAGRALAGVAALGLAGTVGEAGLLHFRGAFQHPAMALPVTIPPAAAALLGARTLSSDPRLSQLTRWGLGLTALLGVAGAAFHARGVSRSMGGWGNWRQNLLAGPPIPAPPSFTGLALAGLAALALMEAAGD